MIGNMFKHIFMIDKSICVTFERIKRGFSGSGQMPLNTLKLVMVLQRTLWGLGALQNRRDDFDALRS